MQFPRGLSKPWRREEFRKLGEMLKSHAERAPLKRNVDPAEVGGTAAFLLSPAGSGITGETLHVDCGYNIMGF